MSHCYAFSALNNLGEDIALSRYQGSVSLIVNTASRCGFTPQYRQLQDLQTRYQSQGFTVLAFPCNQFGAQEPGSDAEIAQFCQLNYQTSFPLFAKIQVNGPQAHPLFQHLTQNARGFLGSRAIKWNFTKFLVDRNGQVLKRYGPLITPQAIAKDIEALLNN